MNARTETSEVALMHVQFAKEMLTEVFEQIRPIREDETSQDGPGMGHLVTYVPMQ